MLQIVMPADCCPAQMFRLIRCPQSLQSSFAFLQFDEDLKRLRYPAATSTGGFVPSATLSGGGGVPVAMDAMASFDVASPVAAFGRVQMRP